MRKNPGYKTDQLKPIYLFETTPIGLAVRKDSPFKTAQDFIDYAKKNPGKLKYSACGPGSMNHLMVVYFQQVTGAKLTYVPYKCFGPATTALLGKHVDVSSPGPASVTPHIAAGKLRPLAVTGA